MEKPSESVCNDKVYRGLFDKHALHLRNYLYYQFGDMTKSEDYVQDSFAKLWQNCKKVSIESAKSFLFTVGKRLFLNDVEHQKVVLKFQKQNTMPSASSEDPDYVYREGEFKDLLEEAIANLPEGQRIAFLMNRIDKLSYKEIAERLELSEKAIEKRISGALRNLKEQVEELQRIKI